MGCQALQGGFRVQGLGLGIRVGDLASRGSTVLRAPKVLG